MLHMPTSTRFAVAVHTLAALAVSGGKPLRSEDLANSVHTGPVVIRSLLSRLSNAGLTTSQLGSGGGALLAKPAKKIRLLDVYEAVEDTQLFSLHRVPPNADCRLAAISRKPCARYWSRPERRLKQSYPRSRLPISRSRLPGLASLYCRARVE